MQRFNIALILLFVCAGASVAHASWDYDTDVVMGTADGNIRARWDDWPPIGWDPISIGDDALWSRQRRDMYYGRFHYQRRAYFSFDLPPRDSEWEVHTVELQYVDDIAFSDHADVPAMWRADIYVGTYGNLGSEDWDAGIPARRQEWSGSPVATMIDLGQVGVDAVGGSDYGVIIHDASIAFGGATPTDPDDVMAMSYPGPEYHYGAQVRRCLLHVTYRRLATGIGSSKSAGEAETWGGIKALYR